MVSGRLVGFGIYAVPFGCVGVRVGGLGWCGWYSLRRLVTIAGLVWVLSVGF